MLKFSRADIAASAEMSGAGVLVTLPLASGTACNAIGVAPSNSNAAQHRSAARTGMPLGLFIVFMSPILHPLPRPGVNSHA